MDDPERPRAAFLCGTDIYFLAGRPDEGFCRELKRLITEQIFRINGIGAALITAINGSDIPMVQTLTFIFAVLVVASNLLADIIYGWLDPRIRYD